MDPAQIKTIPMPAGYRAELYYCSCTSAPCNGTAYKTDAEGMLNYGRLPGNKYMLNWPAHGNDAYLNVIAETPESREKQYETAKLHTLGFVYFIQTVLGYKQIGLADDELQNGLALIPYNREGRRAVGMVRMNVNHILDPYAQDQEQLYRTGIACGDYPVDHHHGQNPATPFIRFPSIPSFNIPLGALVPKNIPGLIVCEKGISVSNIVNGATRLQPVVLLTGEAAGTLAAWCVRHKKELREADTRSIQQELLADKCYLMPYSDVSWDDPAWASIQRIGLTGIMRGTGKPQGWANKTLFHPDSAISIAEFLRDFHSFDSLSVPFSGQQWMTEEKACSLLRQYLSARHNRKQEMASNEEAWSYAGLAHFEPQRQITRKELAVLLDKCVHPFERRGVDLKGKWPGE